MQTKLLRPLADGAGSYVTATFVVPSDQVLSAESAEVMGTEVLVFDGIFAQRQELAPFWDLTVFLEAQDRVNLKRLDYVLAELPAEPIDVVAHVLDWHGKIDRYAAGMQYYLDLVDPMQLADSVIDNNDLANPVLVRQPN